MNLERGFLALLGWPIYTRIREKLRIFIFVPGRNLFPQTLLNQYITGTPQRQQEPNLQRNEKPDRA